ncbi:uncharacterized protein F4822DRAFT_429971 [Hypoxylon trugodes]|uniref:uncharacterized protein n=1 Tax=Hypoxylon trugodes TaxID=326681 RepID=UPI0021A0DAA3|nr:uncharacterized protein F4822DRAFT_429971 [Hypoxylon trugodes]KAI1387215.1 hypothetical protein F4822DRAFT_429971 [Hypoxylon trugodes]
MSSTAIAEISRSDLRSLPDAPTTASISNAKHLSSYNWIEAPTPTIAVPGSPALWAAPKTAQKLKQDSGLIYIAQNAARHPDSPLEPLFRALYITNPSFDINSIDVVTDRNNIRKLLSFIEPSMSKNGLEEFTIGVETVGNTVIFSRDEAKTQEIIRPHEFRGFGHEFEKAYTTDKVKDSTGHHRIISYSFGGLNLIVRYETDGYVGTNSMPSSSSKGQAPADLSSILESLSLGPSSKPPAVDPKGSKLTIKENGQMVTQGSTLEIKTRVSHKPIEIREVAPQLWASQTPRLVRAYHQRGVFRPPVVEDVSAQVKRWELDNQIHLRRLVALIRKIMSLARSRNGSVVLKYDPTRDKLVVREVHRKKMLPEDLYAKWNDGKTVTEALNGLEV